MPVPLATPPASSLDAQNLQLIQSIRNDLEHDASARVIWDYGYNIKAETIVVIKKSDSLLDKIIFIFNWIIGRIDCSATRFFKLTQNLENRVIKERTSKITNLSLEFEQLRTSSEETTIQITSQKDKARREQEAAQREFTQVQRELNDVRCKLSSDNNAASELRRNIQALKDETMKIESVLAQLAREEQGIEARKQELERRHNELEQQQVDFQAKKMMLEQEGKTLPEYYDQLGKKNSQLVSRVSQLEEINSKLVSQEEIKKVRDTICRILYAVLYQHHNERSQILNGVSSAIKTLYK